MDIYIIDALAAGIIRSPSLPAGAGFFFVGKMDWSLRPCIDDRGLNDITVKNRYPLPLIALAFELLKGATIFTKLDLHNANNLVRGRVEDGLQHTNWTLRIPGHAFGLTNAPVVFQALIHDVLRDLLRKKGAFSAAATGPGPSHLLGSLMESCLHSPPLAVLSTLSTERDKAQRRDHGFRIFKQDSFIEGTLISPPEFPLLGEAPMQSLCPLYHEVSVNEDEADGLSSGRDDTY